MVGTVSESKQESEHLLSMPPHNVSRIRVPHGAAGTFSSWFTFVRGQKVPRRAIPGILLGRYRGRIETVQSNDPELWS
jgi:hypothetical protein